MCVKLATKTKPIHLMVSRANSNGYNALAFALIRQKVHATRIENGRKFEYVSIRCIGSNCVHCFFVCADFTSASNDHDNGNGQRSSDSGVKCRRKKRSKRDETSEKRACLLLLG